MNPPATTQPPLSSILKVGSMPSSSTTNPNRPSLSSILTSTSSTKVDPNRPALGDIMSGKTPPPSQVNVSHPEDTSYFQNILNIPKNIVNNDANLGKDFLHTVQNPMELADNARTKTFNALDSIIPKTGNKYIDAGTKTLNQVGSSFVGGAVGTASDVAHVLNDTLGILFQPVSQVAGAVIPKTGNKYIDSAMTGGVAGAGLGGPGGALMGAGLSLASTAIPDIVNNVPGIKDFVDKNPQYKDLISQVTNAAVFATAVHLAKSNGAQDIMNKPISEAVPEIGQNLLDTGKAIVSPVTGAVGAVTGAIKNKLSASNANPQLETSANRVEDPVAQYDEYAQAQKNSNSDVKGDNALGVVGEKTLGPAFDKVVQMRKDAGATMGSELEKVGETPTDTSESIAKLQTNLEKNGLTVDEEGGNLLAGKTSKVTTQDQALLTDYYTKLNALGPNPTMSELDAFLSKTPQELKVYQASNNITGTTNGMRIIQNNLTQLRDDLVSTTPEGTAVNPDLQTYLDARSQYAKLSGFLDDGVKFIGQKTQSGDYAKDSSMLKSSVNSILTGGKKDWLMELENITGEPILDKTVLALQAMKDSGDARGQSLLQSISEGKIPTSVSGIGNKVLGWALDKAKGAIVGAPEDQTRTFLNSLKDNTETTPAPEPTTVYKWSGGQKGADWEQFKNSGSSQFGDGEHVALDSKSSSQFGDNLTSGDVNAKLYDMTKLDNTDLYKDPNYRAWLQTKTSNTPSTDGFADYMKTKGYDGIKYQNDTNDATWAVFPKGGLKKLGFKSK